MPNIEEIRWWTKGRLIAKVISTYKDMVMKSYIIKFIDTKKSRGVSRQHWRWKMSFKCYEFFCCKSHVFCSKKRNTILRVNMVFKIFLKTHQSVDCIFKMLVERKGCESSERGKRSPSLGLQRYIVLQMKKPMSWKLKDFNALKSSLFI